MRHILLTLGFAACAVPAIGSADEFTTDKAKALVPEVAGVSAKELKELFGPGADVKTFKPSAGQSLTWLVMTYAPGPDDHKKTSFRFLGNPPNVAKIVEAITGPPDRNGQHREYASVIHPEYITDCTCKVSGDTATGTVTFKADQVYQGKAEYTARKKDGKWRIEEFRLPDLKITTTLGADGKWVKK